MRWIVVLLVLALSPGLGAQEPSKKKRKAAAAKAHQKPTPEQIRRFNELQKKQP